MTNIRKALWGSALLVALAGCNSEEPAGDAQPAPPPTVPGGPAPGSPPAATPEKTDEAKPKEEMPAPKGDEPKADAPKLEAPAPTPAAPKEEAPAEKKADAAPVKATLSAEELAQVEKLPAEDKAIALAQLVCPVSGEPLGAMGKPVKVSAEGKTFFLCCKGCNEDVQTKPKEVVAKLNSK